MWEDTHYCWVVLCKNFWCQIRQSAFYKHRIPLAETDVYSQAPQIKTKLKVRCDLCQREYLYARTEVMRYEQELPANFSPHALFAAAVPLGVGLLAGALRVIGAVELLVVHALQGGL